MYAFHICYLCIFALILALQKSFLNFYANTGTSKKIGMYCLLNLSLNVKGLYGYLKAVYRAVWLWLEMFELI